ncbi:succinate dehydrogenase/fumarate reductase iron-sulfur subunit [Brenneria tiliae]|uniref:Fumarate reductase iron-sulfur subunit n=1 Tax=Brenneria tiliae TaxID=2914984 RepID=A0ABT0MZU6_9GAMM|nr:2Fe-2S iron-sulfur cluster-binding protein [Brenneria tiliae]MCL2894793.1 2Fe-2S iron-sulfur cluster-binding protein [Brenneria tiliae]
MANEQNTLRVKIARGEPGVRHAVYSVPRRDNQTVLDVVTEIQQRQDPTLSYRFSCRVGVCGSCAVMVNGTPRWACRTHVSRVADKGELVLEPLRNLPPIKDLVVDMREFFTKWQQAGGEFSSGRSRKQDPARIDPQGARRSLANEAIECINCGICYAACDVVAWDKRYLGPAALNRAWTLINDERHEAHADVKARVAEAGGVSACHMQGNCMACCPVGLSPTRSIAGLKRISLWQWFGKA